MNKYGDDLNNINIFPNGKIFRITYDVGMKSLRIISKSSDFFEEIRNFFSIKNKSAFFSQQYGYKGEARLYNINKFGYFKCGLVYNILDWIKNQYGSLEYVAISQNCMLYITEILRPLKKYIDNYTDFEIENIAEATGRNIELKKLSESNPNVVPYNFRDYQKKSVEALLKKSYGRGMIEIPTSGGKTFILSNFIWNLDRLTNKNNKIMILVPNLQLVEQFYSDLIDFGYKKEQLAKFAGGMTKKEKKENDIEKSKIVIANRQYLFKNKNKLPDFDALICDEVHTILAESSAEFVSDFHAKIKIGCSGTIPDDKYKYNQLVGMFGKIAHKEEITKLQEEGFITKLKITSFSILDKFIENDRNFLFHEKSYHKYDPDDINSDLKFDDSVKAEHEYFAKEYKKLYKPVLDYIPTLNGNTLVLFDKIDIGTSLFEYFKELYPNINAVYNDGSTKVKNREDTKSLLEKTEGNVFFANVQILSTGVSIKRLHNIVFCFSSKSTTRIIQSCGRALRLYNDKDYANLIDVSYNFKYSQKHYKSRLALYKQFYNKNKPDKIISIII